MNFMDTGNVVQKPRQVAMAVNLLWVSLCVGLVKTVIYFRDHAATMVSVASGVIFITGMLILIAFFITKISNGKNWARITYLVLLLIGLIPTIRVMFNELSNISLVGAVSVAQTVLQTYALFLLFTRPANTWFRKAQTIE